MLGGSEYLSSSLPPACPPTATRLSKRSPSCVVLRPGVRWAVCVGAERERDDHAAGRRPPLPAALRVGRQRGGGDGGGGARDQSPAGVRPGRGTAEIS